MLKASPVPDWGGGGDLLQVLGGFTILAPLPVPVQHSQQINRYLACWGSYPDRCVRIYQAGSYALTLAFLDPLVLNHARPLEGGGVQ